MKEMKEMKEMTNEEMFYGVMQHLEKMAQEIKSIKDFICHVCSRREDGKDTK